MSFQDLLLFWSYWHLSHVLELRIMGRLRHFMWKGDIKPELPQSTMFEPRTIELYSRPLHSPNLALRSLASSSSL